MRGLHKIKHTFSSLAIRNYRLYFFGMAISSTGTWMQNIGLAWLVLKLTNSGTALGISIALQFLPLLILGPLGGVIVDRFPKRKLLYVTQITAALLALILGILVYTNSAQMWMVYLVAFGIGIVNIIDNPVRQTFIPEMVGEDHLLNAISVNAIQVNLTRVIGPAFAAMLIAAFGMAPLFFLNAFSFVAVIVALSMMNTDELNTRPVSPRTSGQLREGFKYIKSSPVISTILLMVAIVGTLTYEFTVSLPLFAQFTFNGNAATFALFTSALGLGSVFGAIRTTHREKTGLKILVNTLLWFGLSVLILSFAPSVTIAFILIVLVGYFSISFLSLANVLLQTESLPEMRGRVMSVWAMAFLGSTPIGGPIIGFISEHSSPRYGIALGGVAALVAMWIGLREVKKIKK